ncbi:MAG: hypothetical protein ACR2J5_11700, partial [Geodermatophilaceae bacterium]
TPVLAIITFAIVSTTAALFSAKVVDWIFAGAYVWLLLYVVYHMLLIANRFMGSAKNAAHLLGPSGIPLAIAGFVLTIVALYYAFLGSHAFFIQKSAWVLGVALLASIVAIVLPHPHVDPSIDEGHPTDQRTTV